MWSQALRRDLRSLEEEARAFAAALDEAGEWHGGGAALQQLEGRYRFLWGIYCAHSEVLPCLLASRRLGVACFTGYFCFTRQGMKKLIQCMCTHVFTCGCFSQQIVVGAGGT